MSPSSPSTPVLILFVTLPALITIFSEVNTQIIPNIPPIAENFKLEEDVLLYCNPRANSPNYIELKLTDIDRTKDWNYNNPFYIVIHGWTESVDRPWVQSVVDNLGKFTKANVCSLNWEKLAAADILIAERLAGIVGRYLATFLNSLDSIGYNYGKVTLIGHSLGAKVASDAGLALAGRLGSIIALDPAAVGLTGQRAYFVQCIFTAFGRFSPDVGVGHQNFFVNGGVEQPACINAPDFFCSHLMSTQYFKKSIDPKVRYEGKSCRFKFFEICLWEDRDILGLYSERKVGQFKVVTKDDPSKD